MEIKGGVTIRAPRQVVWDSLNAVEVLQRCIPGCESLVQDSDTSFAATVVTKLGPIKARFQGRVSLSDIDAPRRYTLQGEGQGGVAGSAKVTIQVTLEELAADQTQLTYSAQAQLFGKLAQLGSRLVDAAAKSLSEEFFAKFRQAIEGPDSAQDLPSKDLPTETRAHRPPDSQQSGRPVVAATGTEDPIKVFVTDGMAIVTLNRPAVKNAMSLQMWKRLALIFDDLAKDRQVRVVILTGAGGNFCAGADIAEFESVRDNAQQSRDYEVAVDACCSAIFQLPKPTIAVISGYCLGGGAHLAMSCDFRMAAADAVFGIPAGRLSIVYGVNGTAKLLALVGVTRAKQILFSAQRFGADDALRWGFIDHREEATPSDNAGWLGWFKRRQAPLAQDPMAAARRFAQQMIQQAPLTQSGAKFMLNSMALSLAGLDAAEAERRIRQASDSHDYREGRQAFLEKRSPRFQGS